MSGAAVCQEVSCQSRPGRTPPLAKKSLGKKGHVADCIELTDGMLAPVVVNNKEQDSPRRHTDTRGHPMTLEKAVTM